MPLTESQVIASIRERFPGGHGLTDDCGAVPPPPPDHHLLVTTDLMEEGQHFRMAWHPPAMLGRKLLRVNLSDLDASGAIAAGFTLTLALGRNLDAKWLEAFLEGLAREAEVQGVPVIGGDTVGRTCGLGLGITAFGHARRWLHREGLHVGDVLYVDQPLGASLRGLRKLEAGQRWNPDAPDMDLAAHLDPSPNLGLGHRLAQLPEVHACIDLSDGLSKDLAMMASASGLSVVIQADLPSDWIVGGEDYARCFASGAPQTWLEATLGLNLFEVGRVVPSGQAPVLAYHGGSLHPLADLSFDHFGS